jgi:hypothetical protein
VISGLFEAGPGPAPINLRSYVGSHILRVLEIVSVSPPRLKAPEMLKSQVYPNNLCALFKRLAVRLSGGSAI